MDLPEITEKNADELEEIKDAIRNSNMPDSMKPIVIKALELAAWLPLAIQAKEVTLSKLRKLIFGKGYKNLKNSRKKKNSPPSSEREDNTKPDLGVNAEEGSENIESNTSDDENINETNKKTNKKGHGRMPHTVYKDCKEETIASPNQVGDPCPKPLCDGKLRKYPPGTLIRIRGNNMASVTRYTVEKLRCNLCDFIVNPIIPPEVGNEKHDPTFKSMLALQKYYVAVPFYRQEIFQNALGFPLPDSTQWDLIEQLAGACYAPFNALKLCAANGDIIHNDDTPLKILDVIGRIKAGNAGDRTGMFTTGIIAHYEGHEIALFMNGTQHAGENLTEILKNRKDTKSDIIQMCDGLALNIPKGLSTIVCNCLSHGFRKFEELVDYFPEECLHIMHLLGKVYEYDDETKHMSAEARLIYHQRKSEPIMVQLQQYMQTLLDEHKVEPNSELGKAITYMLMRWERLTRFLSIAGAPLDNNIVERALKIAIRNRKASMFYKTEYSAKIGGMITSLIYTCLLSKENPYDYLTQLQRYQKHVNATPSQWLPWNYRETLLTIKETEAEKVNASYQAHALSADHPVAA